METNSLPEAPITDAGGPTGNMSEKDSNDVLSVLRDEDPSQTDDSETPADDQPNDDSVADDATADDSTSADDDTDESTGEETQPEDNNDGDDATAPPAPDDLKFDKDLDDWATKRGYKLTDDSVRRIAQDARNAQRELRQKQEADAVAAKLNSVLPDEPLTPQDDTTPDEHPEDPYYYDPAAEMRKEFKEFQNWTKQQLEQSTGLRLQSEFISSKNVTEAESEAMVSLVQSEKEAGNIEAVKYLSDPKNLPRLYQLAKLEMAENANTNDVADKARAQERERLARISQAGGPNRNPKSTVTSDKKVDNIMAGLLAED